MTLIPGNYPSDMAGTWYWDDVTVVEAPTQPSAVIVPVSGTTAASPSISYPGSAPAEPTWQVALVIPNGVTVTQVSLQNVSSGEPTCTVPNLSLTNGTFYLLLDCSGAGVPSAGPATTPNNNGYALLAHNTVGFGVTLYSTGTGQVDQDFTGKPPHVVPSASPSIPPTPMVNTLALSVVSTGGAPTSVTLSALAPARYYR